MMRLPIVLLAVLGAMPLAAQVPTPAPAPVPGVAPPDELPLSQRRNDEGVAAFKAGRHADAITAFEAAITAGEKEEASARTLATFRKNLLTAHLAIVRRDLDARDWDAVERRLDLAARLVEKTDSSVATWRGVMWYERGFPAAAVDHLLEALRRDEKDATAQFFMGRVRYDREELESAIEAWTRAAELDADRREAIESWIEKARRELAVEASMQTLRSTHFVCKYADEHGREVADTVLKWLEDIYVEVGGRLQVHPDRVLTIVLYADREFSAATGAHAWVAGLFDGKVRLPVKNFARRGPAIKDTLAHEYTHYAIRNVTDHCPAWLNEGLAQLAEGDGGVDARSQAGLGKLAAAGGLLDFAGLEISFVRLADQRQVPLAYRQSKSFVHHLVSKHGMRAIEALLRRLDGRRPFADCFREALRRTFEEERSAWIAALPDR
ncbi:MAG: hypothetical protein R3F20_18330 [Planctomycetota bacterium]